MTKNKTNKNKKYQEQVSQIEEDQRVYLEEFGIEQKITREYGWGERGKKLRGWIIGKKSRKINVIAAYRQGKIIAPMVYEGTMTTPCFNEYIKKCLIPELNPGDVVIMDNASFHQSPKVTELLAEQGGGMLFLPAYSPEFNPIEHLWAAVKSQVRRVHSQFPSRTDTLCYLFSSPPTFS